MKTIHKQTAKECEETFDRVLGIKPAPKKRKAKRVVAVYHKGSGDGLFTACYVLPADPASVERMVGQVAEAIFSETLLPSVTCLKIARSALAAIGIRSK